MRTESEHPITESGNGRLKRLIQEGNAWKGSIIREGSIRRQGE